MRMKKRLLLPLAIGLLAVVAASGVAYAFWTASGSGTGTASAGNGSQRRRPRDRPALSPMYPGGNAQTLSGDFDNGNAGPVYISTVTVSIVSVTKAAGAPSGTCDPTDFTLSPTQATVNAEILAGTGVGSLERPADQVQRQGVEPGCLQGRDGQPRLFGPVTPTADEGGPEQGRPTGS